MIGLTHLNLSLRAQRGNLVARASTQLRKSYRDSVALRDVVGRGLGRPIGRTQTRNVSDGMTSESGFAGFKVEVTQLSTCSRYEIATLRSQ